MSPRPYRLGQRRVAVEQTRARVIAAARELLVAPGGFSVFTVEAVARQAGVARMTVYYQFGSKQGLLEALFDSLAQRGGMGRLAVAFQQPEPRDALADFVRTFASFWASDRLIIRRLRALGALDPELEQVVRARDERRREGLLVIVHRLAERRRASSVSPGETVDLLHTLTSFEVYDALAGPARSSEEVAHLVCRLAAAAVNLDTP